MALKKTAAEKKTVLMSALTPSALTTVRRAFVYSFKRLLQETYNSETIHIQ